MDSAVAATMPLEEHSSIDNFQAKSRFKNFLASEGVGTDDQGNKMYIDAAAVCINAEYECNIDESIGKDMLGIDRSDSSCWRPQLPPPALLDYIKLIASKRLQLHAKLNAEKMNQDDNDDDNGKYPPKNFNDLEHALSGSALVAVGILIEELTRDLMVSWNKRNYEANKNYNTQPKEKGSNRSTTSSSQSKSSDHPRSSESDDENDNDNENEIDVSETNSSGNLKRNFHDFNGAGPLGPVSRKNIRIEARLQLQGALFKTQSDKSNKSVKAEKLKKIELEKLIGGKGRNQEVDPGPSVVTAVLLRNRLEVSKFLHADIILI